MDKKSAVKGIEHCFVEMVKDGVSFAHLWRDDDSPDNWFWTDNEQHPIPSSAVLVRPTDDPEHIYHTIDKIHIAENLFALAQTNGKAKEVLVLLTTEAQSP